MTSHNLQQEIEARLENKDFHLPVINHTAVELQRLMSSSKCQLSQLAQVIEKDQSLATKVLNVANSPFFSGLKKIGNVRDAIVRVGMKEIFVLVVTLAQKNLYQGGNNRYGSYMEKLWQHALATAMGGRWLCVRMNQRQKADELFMAGLLHDIGKLALVKLVQELEEENGQEGFSPSEALLQEILESMHTTVGGSLLEKQMLPEFYCMVARNHHLENNDSSEEMDIIKVANLACRKLGIGIQHDPEVIITATPNADRLGLSDIDVAELEVTMEEMLNEMNDRLA
ncbi:MAG: HDOD domain-containing protein [Deltaproteobacteria bacterium]|nr:HDOD domain-containing protein [Deltaproteobacteria bacterium]MBW2071038.1 HDOD domain-containing protein [Deltaproteobacteria bacterium]